ncbi:TetR/AcrR family transcriptional regulator [Acinetobacter calcoaceticus]|uniref:TetR/AcrR family transcriptional regulator n=1 Tax=Acinetobacter calcoaceticus TaxID=471 RepID=UPI002B2B55FD|nr:TetR/AcrR family transcriptional regulator [Acinetobacter baumannii]
MTNIRKQRSRAPQQRQIERTNQILDCMEALLKEKEINDINLAEISELTGIALPSIYYHFPNKNSILVALTERVHEVWRENIRSKISSDIGSWQELIRQFIFIGANHLKENSYVSKLILSSNSPAETKEVDSNQCANLAITIMDTLDKHFEGLNKSRYTEKMIIAVYILDGIWKNAFFQYGVVPDEVVRESQKALIAYLRCYFPEELEQRDLKV